MINNWRVPSLSKINLRPILRFTNVQNNFNRKRSRRIGRLVTNAVTRDFNY